ncbi:MAG: peptidoglycan DD-metalloendopeptidase family protein [Nitrospirae bacterium]|nr:peptidoglycan DD-metalloendopeptidase family protein [Nitrospirota bacterium]
MSLTIMLCPSFAHAQKKSPKEEYKKIQKELKERHKKLETIKKSEHATSENLMKIRIELTNIEGNISAQRKRIAVMQRNITALQTDINSRKSALQAQGSLLKKRLRVLQRVGAAKDPFIAIITGEEISDTLRMIRHINDISAYDYRLMEKYKRDIAALNERQMRFRALASELKTEEDGLLKLNDSMQQKKKEKEVLLAGLRRERDSYEKMIRELKQASSSLLRIIQESERKGRSLKIRETPLKKRDQNKREEQLTDSEFLRLRGRLSWPVNGSLIFKYGSQTDPVFNLPIFRSGIHVKTAGNGPVKAVYSGKIVYAGDFKGYNKLMVVSHGSGYHTVYGNLGRIFLKDGAIIKEHENIGEVGESESLGMPALYFEVRHKGKPLDPLQWLSKK